MMKKDLFATYGKKNWKNIIIRLCICLLFPITILLKNFGKSNPLIIENVYSKNIYPILSQSLGVIFRIIPISFAEIIVYAGIIFTIIWFGWISYRLLKLEHPIFRFAKIVSGLLVFICVMYFSFYAVWGINYYRMPLANELGYDVTPVDKYELQELLFKLTEEINDVRSQLNEDADGLVVYDNTNFEMLSNVPDLFKQASKKYEFLSGYYSKPKLVFASKIMCYTEIVGIFIPFTMEANVNVAAPDMSIYVTATHEASHQRGYASEDEANYIATLVCRMSDDPYIKYSGLQLALTHVANALYSADNDLYYEVSALYGDGLKRDLRAKKEFWKQYEGKVAETVTTANDNYLKSNDQEDGIKSYGRMVDLLIGEFRANIIIN